MPAKTSAVAATLLVVSGLVSAAEQDAQRRDSTEQNRIYSTPEERRDAGLKYEIVPGLAVSALAELEYSVQRAGLVEGSFHARTEDFSKAFQLVLEATPRSWAKVDVVYQYNDPPDQNSSRHTLDEAIASFDVGALELEMGKLYLPFGMYFSRFVSGPLLEFGETQARGASFLYKPFTRFDVAAFAYQGAAEALESGGENRDWGLAANAAPFGSCVMGVSYLSDLADSRARLLRDHQDRYTAQIAGWSAYATAIYGRIGVTAEFVGALDSFEELDPMHDKPRAWNIELAFAHDGRLDWALRLEGSTELEDAPHRQGGIAATWRVLRNATVTGEYLLGRFEPGVAQDAEGQELKRLRQFGMQISFAF